jgi:hypothetical protein
VETTLLSKILFIVTVTLTFDPKVNRILRLPQGKHVVKFGKDQIYRTKVIVWKRPCCQNYIYSNDDLDLLPNDPKIYWVLPLPQGNHVAKFVKDPIYRTKVIVRKRPCCQKLYLHLTVTLTFDLMTPK